MNKQFLKDSFGWGFLLWLIGYVMGIVLFAFVPQNIMGWIISPIATLITLWVLFKKIKGNTWPYYLGLAIIWTAVAVIFDYLFIVKAFSSIGYYKLDIYVYYALMLILPLVAGLIKRVKFKNI